MEKISSLLLTASILMLMSSPVVALLGIYYSWAVHNRTWADILWVLVYKSIVLLIAGIMGIRGATKPYKAKACFVTGLSALIFSVLHLTVIFIFNGIDFLGAFTIFLIFMSNTPIPLLYTIASYKAHKRASSCQK